MKKLFTLMLFAVMILPASAQDTIVFKNADDIQGKVLEITSTSISYKRWDNQDGPTYSVPKSNVLFIKYQNGYKEVISTVNNSNAAEAASYMGDNAAYSVNKKVRFQGYAYCGTTFADYCAGPTMDLLFGARITDYFFLGLDIGAHCMFLPFDDYDDDFFGYSPIALNMKAYIPIEGKLFPYINFSCGGLVDYTTALGGFYCQVGAGMDYRRFSFGIGYENYAVYGHIGYVKLGVRFGKK